MFTLMIFAVVSLPFEELKSYQQNLRLVPEHPASRAKGLGRRAGRSQPVAGWLWGRCWGGDSFGSEKSYVPSPFLSPSSC